MGNLARQLEADRAMRDAARTAFDARYGAIKADMEKRGIAGRVIDESIEQAREMLDEAVDIAESNPGVVGGTLAALMLWFLRNPIMAWFDTALGPDAKWKKEADND
ncbi:hypothetical protein [Novosphingobium pentaromativorans]|uniref:Uncharacterized protein n=1 Tax=Novosphingobium pentaromativorans US6-1 TaxID=1088721 RepID=G6E6Q8_9SPHN|nr:hypothetical protein [Novosphingobium pentaromativorans]AIT78443.1 hypothetical protein JI59_00680 [Novosphingobium pentaromativorans US6-1]EHJ62954.1 hypothetical protein NSU_0029 [Novosphingobium pentaromativorans US6-1]